MVVHAPIDVFSFAGPRHGKTEVIATVAEIARQYELKRYLPEVVIADGDRAATISNVAFVQRATGRTLTFRLADFLRFENALLIDFREFSDTFDVAQQALGRWLDV